MANEIRDAGTVVASNPQAHGRRPRAPFYFATGAEFPFRVRDGIRVRLNFVPDDELREVVVHRITMVSWSMGVIA